MNYFVSTEMGIANLLQRQFDWTANTLFFEEIPHARDPSRNKYIVANDDVVLCAPVSPPRRTRSPIGGLTKAYTHSESKRTLCLMVFVKGFISIPGASMVWPSFPELKVLMN
jgi:hypothetical protein